MMLNLKEETKHEIVPTRSATINKVSIFYRKGGVGKTTTACGTATYLADSGKKLC